MRAILLSLILFLLTAFSAQAITIEVDGDLSDWGLNTSCFAKNGNDWSQVKPGVFVWQEDWVKKYNGKKGWVEPGYGGQKYDVEAVLATFDATHLYIAISTGFPQKGRKYTDNDGNTFWFDAGDIFLDIGNDDKWDYAFVVSNYDNGSKTRVLKLGGLYKVSSWKDVYYSSYSVSNPWRIDNGTYVGKGSLAYVPDTIHACNGTGHCNHCGCNNNHCNCDCFSRYFIEVGIPLELLGNFTEVKIHWTMECGNDYGEVVAHTPEPASILLLGAGLFAVGIVVRRRKS